MNPKSKTTGKSSQELEKVHQTLREYESILNILPDIIYKIDPEGHFIYLSNSVVLLGYQPEELIGKHFSVLIHPEDVADISREKVLPKFRGRVTGNQNAPKLFDERRTGRRFTKDLQVRLIPKIARQVATSETLPNVEGQVTSVGVYSNLVQEKDKQFEGSSGRIVLKAGLRSEKETLFGQLTQFDESDTERSQSSQGFEGTVGVIRDVTDLKHLEEKKLQLEQQLFHSKKMQAIGELAGGIAHDFNNLLSIMLGQAEMMLLKSGSFDSPLSHSMETIKNTILQAADLNSKLLTFARKVKYSELPVNLHEIVADSIHLLSHSIDKKINIRQELTAGRSTIIGDTGLLKNALINIALNARDAMPDGGDLVFRTRIDDEATVRAQFPNRDVQEDAYIVVSIQDTGIGMDQEVRERLFEPFFTTKSLGKGTGLGLACVDGIVEMHKGFIEVESLKGVGSTFSLFFPLAKSVAAVQTPEPLEIQGSLPKEKRILILDDEKVVLQTQSLLLAEFGYDVKVFSEAASAIDYYKENHDEIDLVILDMNMPKLSGKECYQEFKKIRPDVRVIISTGYNIETEAEELLKTGIAGLIQKPFTSNQLMSMIAKVLGQPPLKR
jgi:two-component system cell cycle sensor histidine kinase/response regulator CckA